MANNIGGGKNDDYLNAPDTAGRPMALVSLILVFLLIAGVAMALFVGGRWVYNQYVKNDDTSQVATEEQTQQDSQATGPQDDQDATQANGGTTEQPSDQSANNTADQANSQATGDTSSTSAGTTDQQQTSNNSTSQPSNGVVVTGPDTEEVPQTGPESLLVIFIGVSVLAAILHRNWLIRKL